MRSAVLWVVLVAGGCHLVFPHAPGAGDGPRVERVVSDSLDLGHERDRRDRGLDGSNRDHRGDALRDRSPDLPRDLAVVDAPRDRGLEGKADSAVDASPPLVATGESCSNGAAGGCCSDKWCWQSPLPQGNDLQGAFALAADDVTMVGVHGTILHFYKGAFYRDRLPSAARPTLRGIWGTSLPTRVLFAVGDGGTVLRRDPGSPIWLQETSTASQLNAVFGLSANEIYAVGNGGVVLRRDAAGNWPKAPGWSLLNTVTLRAVWSSGSTLYVGGFESGLPRLWSKSGSGAPVVENMGGGGGTVEAIWGDGVKVYAVGTNLIREKQGSGQFFSIPPGTGNYRSVWGAGGKTWVVGSNSANAHGIHPLGDLTKTHGDGDLQTIHVAPNGTGFAVGIRGAIWSDGTGSWSPLSIHPTRNPVLAIWGDKELPWVATEGGELLRYSGTSWQTHAAYGPPHAGMLSYRAISGQGTYKLAVGQALNACPYNSAEVPNLAQPSYFGASSVAMNGLWVEGTQKAEAVSGNGVYTLGGTTWTQATPTQGVDLRGIWGLGAGATVVAVGPSQVCSRSTPAGWSCSGDGSNALQAIWGSGSQLFAVGHQRISVATIFGSGQVSWSNDTVLPQPGELNAVWGRNATEVYAVGDEGLIRRRGNPPSWTAEESGTSRNLHGVYLPPVGLPSVCEVWAVGALGTILCKKL